MAAGRPSRPSAINAGHTLHPVRVLGLPDVRCERSAIAASDRPTSDLRRHSQAGTTASTNRPPGVTRSVLLPSRDAHLRSPPGALQRAPAAQDASLVAFPITRSALLLRPAADPEQELDLVLFPPLTWPLLRGSGTAANSAETSASTRPLAQSMQAPETRIWRIAGRPCRPAALLIVWHGRPNRAPLTGSPTAAASGRCSSSHASAGTRG
jgi:hypothetical protein